VISPPLIITRAQIDELVEKFRAGIEAAAIELSRRYPCTDESL
jgi:adenosylmethionine-8-amino-7-oxononanoate aminotransferase